jgi:hypothetical protein
MKKLQMFATAAGIIMVLAGPTLAAQRAHRGADAYASGAATDRSGAYYYGPQNAQGVNAQGRAFAAPVQSGPAAQYERGGNLPYPDRPYGDPGRW